MKNQQRNQYSKSLSTLPSGVSLLRKFRQLLMLLIILTLTLGLAGPALACGAATGPRVGIWIGIEVDDSSNNVWIIVRRYQTFAATTNQFCACGIRKTASISSISSVQFLNRNTQQPVAGFSFASNATTSEDMDTSQGGTWFGFLSPVNQAVSEGTPLDLVFQGELEPGATFAQVKAELLAAGSVIGSDVANADGTLTGMHPTFPEPGVVDPAPPKSTPPAAWLAGQQAGPSHSFGVTFEDADDGLRRIRVLDSVNAEVSLPSFASGITDPVTVSASMQDHSQAAYVEIEACNVHGRCIIYDPLLSSLDPGERKMATQTLTGVHPARHFVEIHNADPGVRMVAVFVNGRKFSIRPLHGRERLHFDLSMGMIDEENTIKMVVRGSPGSSALVSIAEYD